MHGVDVEGGVVIRRRLRRAEVAKFFAGLAPCLVGMEACAGAHFWARTIADLGDQVRLMPSAYVKPDARRQKNDRADAAAILRGHAALDAVRAHQGRSAAGDAADPIGHATCWCGRHQSINALRAHFAEFGVVVPKGAQHGRRLVAMLLTGETLAC